MTKMVFTAPLLLAARGEDCGGDRESASRHLTTAVM
jgi:hypothetical protein